MVRKKRLLAGVLSFALVLSAFVINPIEAKAAGWLERVKEINLDTKYIESFSEEEEIEEEGLGGTYYKSYLLDIPADGEISLKYVFPEMDTTCNMYYLYFYSVDTVEQQKDTEVIVFRFNDADGLWYNYDMTVELNKGQYYMVVKNWVYGGLSLFTCDYSLTIEYTAYVDSTSIESLKGKKASVKTKWSKVSDVSGYEVQYSLNEDFSSKVKTVLVKGAKQTKKTIGKLKNKKDYYFRIRCFKDVEVNGKDTRYYSDWSSIDSTITK